jgi:predicted porin
MALFNLQYIRGALAAATLCASAGAWAQSSVTIYGILDVNISHISNIDGTSASSTRMNSGGRSSSRWGLRGNEDLGGGMSAFFTLEADVSVDSGDTDPRYFGRMSYVGLRGGWGEVRLGRDYAPIFYAGASVEPLSCCRVGHGSFLSLGNAGAPNDDGRVSNGIAYWGQFGNVRTQIQYGLGEVAGSNSAGRQIGLNAMYTAGPVHLAAGYHNNNVGSTGRDKSAVVGARYTLGNARLFAAYQSNKSATFTPAASSKNHVAWGGVSYDLSPQVELVAAVYRRDTRASSNDATLYVVGANYKFSKRTELYADYGHVSNGATGAFGVSAGSTTLVGGSQSHLQAGIRHRF